MKKIIITIDGHSGCGKSTLAKLIANKLAYTYIDTGAMYRAITYFFNKNNFIKAGELVGDWKKALMDINLSFDENKDFPGFVIHLNGSCVEEKIRTMEISNLVSLVSKEGPVRQKLVEYQQFLGRQKAVVMDGRDIGSVVFPSAEIKLWVTASVAVRAERRFKELKAKNEKVTIQEVAQNIEKRDFEDSNREISPLIKPKNAIEIDNSLLTIQETLSSSMYFINAYLLTNN